MTNHPQNYSSIEYLQKLETKSLSRGDTALASYYRNAVQWLNNHPESYILDIPKDLYPSNIFEKNQFHDNLMRYFIF